MKKNKLTLALEKFVAAYRTHYSTIAPQILSEMMDSSADDPSFNDLFVLLSQDRKQVVETLQNSIAINKIFFEMKNDFVEDMIKNLRDMNHLQEEEKRLEEKIAKEAAQSSEKNKKIKQMILDLGLYTKQKQILKTILDVK
jgi:uncharacterized protein YdiU (UPF0061 family)